MKKEKATFAAGCFWGVEALFLALQGVSDTTVGYTGGHLDNPTYAQVCTDTTGHAEAVQIEYDPTLVSYEKLLDLFWENHNPTTLNRQGPDVGSQYRSIIYYHTAAQHAAALESKDNLTLSKKHKTAIVTQILPAEMFYPAEEYHQRYLEKQGFKHCHLPKNE